jgi:GNAT superfamily N-acetyltransferase
MSIFIRHAKPGDEQLVYDYVCKLADYEKLRHKVSTTVSDIGESLFGAAPRVFCDLAFWNDEPAGLALWFYNYSTFRGRAGVYLEDLFVDDAMRGKGIGKSLLQHLAARCIAEGLPRLQWSVLDWNAPSIAFYKSLGAVPQDEWTLFDVTDGALQKLAAA